jgi:hypothetical protein
VRGVSFIDKTSAKARELGGFGPDWHAWYFESVANGLLVKGAVCPLKTRGRNKGEPNYRKHGEVSTVIIPTEQLP